MSLCLSADIFLLLCEKSLEAILLRREKVLVQGTTNSLQKFFSDAAAREFEIVGVVSDDKISVQGLEVMQLQNLPRFASS